MLEDSLAGTEGCLCGCEGMREEPESGVLGVETRGADKGEVGGPDRLVKAAIGET